ncbi:MAG: membrane dipeptidase [Candidatus Zixiibacteriota bacterium]|nr:MAG: membrane dipeptidase [candidate division Zixibacteria bacterium]
MTITLANREFDISKFTRRDFLSNSLRASVGLLGTGSVLSALGCATRRPSLVPRPTRRVLADLHCHSVINDWNRQTPLGLRFPALVWLAEKFFNRTGMEWEDCHRAGVDVICVAHFNVFDEWLSMPTDPNPEAPVNTFRMMDQLQEQLSGPARPYATLAKNATMLQKLTSIPKTSADYRIAVVHTVEGGHALGGSIDPLEQLARRGVAMLDVTHFFSKDIASAANSYPFFPDGNNRRPHLGLSEFGRDVIHEMERLGMIVDVTHATATAIDDIIKVATRPLAVSHASSRTLSEHPYAVYDDQVQQIVSDGGIMGVIIDPYLLGNYTTASLAEKEGSLRDVVRQVLHLVKVCGTHKHVGIGSDFSGYIGAPRDMNRISQIHRLSNMLESEFGNSDVVEDIMANNAMEFLKTNWKTGV